MLGIILIVGSILIGILMQHAIQYHESIKQQLREKLNIYLSDDVKMSQYADIGYYNIQHYKLKYPDDKEDLVHKFYLSYGFFWVSAGLFVLLFIFFASQLPVEKLTSMH